MINVVKKVIMVLCIFIIASLLFSGPSNTNNQVSSEVVEIIDKNSSIIEDGYVNEDIIENKKNNNVFVFIVSSISNVITSLFNVIFDLISGVFSSFTN